MRFLAALVVVVVLAAVGAGGGYLWFLNAVAAPGPLREPVIVRISPGSGGGAFARELTRAGVIQRPWMFELEARRRDQGRALKPGEYRFEAAVSIGEVLDRIVRRDVVAHTVTIPEGLVSADIRRIFLENEVLDGAVSSEFRDGELLPETYRFEWGDTRDGVVARMRAAQTTLLAELWENRAADLPLRTPEEAVILASIVEKETGVAGERARVAGVFTNRLRLGMRLQSDPTVIYGLAPDSGDLKRPLTKSDLERPTPFNTYVIAGLPPGPICHPGRAALAAVMAPARTNDLYFVADGSGGHAFAATLADHERNVARWRKLRQNRPQ